MSTTLIGIATTLGGTIADKGVAAILEGNEAKIILWRAVKKTSKRFKGYAPGGQKAVKYYLKDWTDSQDFTAFLKNLENDESVESTVLKAIKSFKICSVSDLNKNAESVLIYFFTEINNGLLKSSRGLILIYNRILMRIDQISDEIKLGNRRIEEKIDKQNDTLDELVKSQAFFTGNQKLAIEDLLSASQEWSSIKKYIETGAFNEAKSEIEIRLSKLNELYKKHPDSKSIFNDHHVELLLKLASLLSNLGKMEMSKSTYFEAKGIGIETPYLKRLESKILINLNMVSELKALVMEGELQEKEMAMLELYFLEGKLDEFLYNLPEERNDFRIIYLELLAKISELNDNDFSEHSLEIYNDLQKSYQLSGNQPIHKIQLTIVAIKYLYRICYSMVPLELINRKEIVDIIRNYIDLSILICIEVNYTRGVIIILQNAKQFYALLDEEEAIKSTEEEILKYIGDEDNADGLGVNPGNISRAIEVHNRAVNLMNTSETADLEMVEHLLQTAFELSEKEEKPVTGQSLVNYYLNNDEIEKAEKILSRLSEISPHSFSMIELAIIERKGNSENLQIQVKNLVDKFPLSIQFRQFYVELLIQTISKNRNENNVSDNDGLIGEVKFHTRSLNDLLPSDSNNILKASAFIANKDFSNSIRTLNEVSNDTKVYITALRLRAHCLIETERLNDIPGVFVELFEITKEPEYANESAKYYLNNDQIDDAYRLLREWVKEFPDDPALIANYAVSIISKGEVTPEEAEEALEWFKKANKLNPGLSNIYLAMGKAAKLAGKENEHLEYISKNWAEVPLVTINRKEDFRELNQKMEKGLVRLEMSGKEGIKAFIEWNNEFKSALNTFHNNDLMTYIDTFAKNGQAWPQWIGWTAFSEKYYYENDFSIAVKSPWPYTRRVKSKKKGLLLDLTALLSLCVLSQTDKIIRKISSQGHKIFLRRNELRNLRRTVNKPEEAHFDVIKFPYDELFNFLDESETIPNYSEIKWNEYSALVPEEIHTSLGNHLPDYGLSLSLDNSCFIFDKIDGMEEENVTLLDLFTPSRVLLKSLVSNGLIGENEADYACTQDIRFKDWRDAKDISLPNTVVFSAFSIQHWYESGLLAVSNKDWVNGKELWPKIFLGPFGVNYLLNESILTENEKKANVIASKQLEDLENLISDEIIDILFDHEESEILNSSIFSSSNVNAMRLLDLAKSNDLDLWTDDRVFGYLLWQYNHPLPVQELREEFSRLHEKYTSIGFFTTEDVLEKIHCEADSVEFSEAMGYKLVELGYRPLNFRLATNYLLNNFSYNSELPKYKSFLQTLEGHLVDELYNRASEADPKPLQRLFLARIVPNILATILLDKSNRPIAERKQFASDILTSVIKYVDLYLNEMKDKISSFWASILHEIVEYKYLINSDSHDDNIDELMREVLDWYSKSLIKHEDESGIKETVISIEDYIVNYVLTIKNMPIDERDSSQHDVTKETVNREIKFFITDRIRFLIQPLVHDDLLKHFNPLLRRCLGHISLFSDEFKLNDVYIFNKDDEVIKDVITEDELEIFALDIFRDILLGNRELGKFLTSDLRVYCTWNRLVPQKVQSEEGETYGVSINISMLRLILRDELHLMPQVIKGIITQLQLIDPNLGKTITDLNKELIDSDPSKRKEARENIAFSIISSNYFELQRNLSHAFYQVQENRTDELDSFLRPESGWCLENIHPSITEIKDREVPLDFLIDLALLSLSSNLLYANCQKGIENLKSELEKKEQGIIDLYSFYPSLFGEEISSFKFSYRFLELLLLCSSATDKLLINDEEVYARDFIEEFLDQLLSVNDETTKSVDTYRQSDLKIIHSCLLRLALFVNGAPKHMSTWNDEFKNNDKVTDRLLSNVLIFTHRLIPLLRGKYGSRFDILKDELLSTLKSLSIPYEEPQIFLDRFNPLLFGPHLLDHEVSSILYVLKVFVSNNPNPELILNLTRIIELSEQWSQTKNVAAEEIYEGQKNQSSNVLNLTMPLSPKEASKELIQEINKKLR